METIAKIRLLYHNQKKSVSEIARAVRMSRNTVRKYLHYDGDVPQYAREGIPKPQLGPYEALLQRWLETEFHFPRKQRRTARRLYEDLRKGEAYQFDWSTEIVTLGGVDHQVKVAHFRLTHSRMSFVRAYPRETAERQLPCPTVLPHEDMLPGSGCRYLVSFP